MALKLSRYNLACIAIFSRKKRNFDILCKQNRYKWNGKKSQNQKLFCPACICEKSEQRKLIFWWLAWLFWYENNSNCYFVPVLSSTTGLPSRPFSTPTTTATKRKTSRLYLLEYQIQLCILSFHSLPLFVYFLSFFIFPHLHDPMHLSEHLYFPPPSSGPSKSAPFSNATSSYISIGLLSFCRLCVCSCVYVSLCVCVFVCVCVSVCIHCVVFYCIDSSSFFSLSLVFQLPMPCQ